MQKKVGLYFGSFNPIHIGHLIIAESISENYSLDEVWFVVSPQNPKKNTDELSDESLRLQMVSLAIHGNPKFKPCDVEFSLSRPSYTIHTLQFLKFEFPENLFGLILGADNLSIFDQWKNYEDILNNFPIYTYPRTGYDIKEEIWSHAVFMSELPYLDISSTYIRKLIREKRSIQYLVPDAVIQFIEEHTLYSKKSDS